MKIKPPKNFVRYKTALRVIPIQTEKICPTFPRLFLTKLQAICRTKAHFSIQILREHNVQK